MFEQNNVGVRMSNPLAHFASDLEISSDHIADFSSVALSIIEKIGMIQLKYLLRNLK